MTDVDPPFVDAKNNIPELEEVNGVETEGQGGKVIPSQDDGENLPKRVSPKTSKG